MPATTRAERISDAIDPLLTYMGVAETKKKRRNIAPVPMHHFDGAYALQVGRGWKEFRDEDEGAYFSPEQFDRDTVPRLDVSIVHPPHEDSRHDTICQLTRVRSVSPRTIRGKVQRFLPKPIEVSFGWLRDDCTFESGRRFYGWNRDQWVHLGSSTDPRGGRQLPSMDTQIRMAQSIAYSRDMEWRVRIGWVGYPMIEVPTDPVGVRAIFRLRDLAPGRKRRAALKHWVGEHWRRKRTDPNVEGLVREHLRGGTDFLWNNFRCRVIPAEFDIRREQLAVERRAAAKARGDDVRDSTKGRP